MGHFFLRRRFGRCGCLNRRGTSRYLYDFAEPMRSEILDLLFLERDRRNWGTCDGLKSSKLDEGAFTMICKLIWIQIDSW